VVASYRARDLQRRVSFQVCGVVVVTVVVGTLALTRLTRTPEFVSSGVGAYSAAREVPTPIAGETAPRTRDPRLQQAIDQTCTAELGERLDRLFPTKRIRRFSDGQPSGGHVVADGPRWDAAGHRAQKTAVQAASLCIFAGKAFEVRDSRSGAPLAAWSQAAGYVDVRAPRRQRSVSAPAAVRSGAPLAADRGKAELITVAPLDDLDCYAYPDPGADARSLTPELRIRRAPSRRARVIDVVADHWVLAARLRCGDWTYVNGRSGTAQSASGWVPSALLTRGWAADGRKVLGIDDYRLPRGTDRAPIRP